MENKTQSLEMKITRLGDNPNMGTLHITETFMPDAPMDELEQAEELLQIAYEDFTFNREAMTITFSVTDDMDKLWDIMTGHTLAYSTLGEKTLTQIMQEMAIGHLRAERQAQETRRFATMPIDPFMNTGDFPEDFCGNEE